MVRKVLIARRKKARERVLLAYEGCELLIFGLWFLSSGLGIRLPAMDSGVSGLALAASQRTACEQRRTGPDTRRRTGRGALN